MPRSRLAWATLVALAAACLFAGKSSATATTGCGAAYSYAGLGTAKLSHGAAATITPLAAPDVVEGHVAGWVGVGGDGYGPGGSAEWIQVGLSALPGGPSSLYYEVRQPGWAAKYVQIKSVVALGESHRVAVLEVRGKPGVWRVWVDNRPVSPPYFLPGSHTGWDPQATAESWNDGHNVCNGYAYRFDQVSVARQPGGDWQTLAGGFKFQDPGYSMTRSSATSFVASVRS